MPKLNKTIQVKPPKPVPDHPWRALALSKKSGDVVASFEGCILILG
jgi:hypothetical protein